MFTPFFLSSEIQVVEMLYFNISINISYGEMEDMI